MKTEPKAEFTMARIDWEVREQIKARRRKLKRSFISSPQTENFHPENSSFRRRKEQIRKERRGKRAFNNLCMLLGIGG